MNNCTVCSQPVDEHLEGRKTDRCVAEKLGWKEIGNDGGYKSGLHGRHPIHKKGCSTQGIPHYSSPTMSAETWGLTEKIDCEWSLYPEGEQFVFFWDSDPHPYLTFKAPTASLAIIRAFLACEL